MAGGAAPRVHFTPEFVAHTPNSSGEWHELVDHLLAVGSVAGEFADRFGGAGLAMWAGRWHDLGKADRRFRQYLIDAAAGRPATSPGIGHASAGSLVATEHGLDAVALAIAGHHAGLPAMRELKQVAARARADPGSVDAVDALRRLPELVFVGSTRGAYPSWLLEANHRPAPLRLEMLIRMVFSALVDADRLDTEAHFAPERTIARRGTAAFGELAGRLAERRARQVADRVADPVTAWRDQIRELVVTAAASTARSVFTFTSPTGSGKTLTALEAALRHAQEHQLRRVVFAVPFISVTEQVASVVRSVVDLGGDAVLEHHCGVTADEYNQDMAALRLRLATENWDMPVVVTTTVRLLESLFSNRPTPCRRLHNLAGCVIVIDETQSIPWRLIDPTAEMLGQLVEDFGASVILSTATQPPFDRLPAFSRGGERPIELLADRQVWFDRFRRATPEVMAGRPSWDEVVEEVEARAAASGGQALVVLNTIADAEAVFAGLRWSADATLLTSRLCGAHRADVLQRVLRLLADGEPVIVVSTQLIEAGVDIDFPVALRAVGPLPSIAQVAGRVNRHGLRESGALVVFDPADGSVPPGEYKVGTSITRSMMAAGADLLSAESTERYFDLFLAAARAELGSTKFRDCRGALDFPQVAVDYRLIEDDTVGVLVPYGDFDPAALEAPVDAAEGRRTMRRLQRYTVSLRRRAFDSAQSAGLTQEVPGLPISRWLGGYDAVTGLMLHDRSNAEVW